MKTPEALNRLADITASQWGLVTARQAEDAGLAYIDLSRLTRAGQLERLEQGVYRLAGAPGDDLEPLRAAWLSTEPGRLAGDRLADRENGVVISGTSAATVHRIGDLSQDAHYFTAPTRRQSKRHDIRYRKRALPRESVVIREGLPVTSQEQTVVDLLDEGQDLTLVAQVVRDASPEINLDALRKLLTTAYQGRSAWHNTDTTWEKLLRLARLDDATIADEVADSPVGTLLAAKFFRELSETLSKMNADTDLRNAIMHNVAIEADPNESTSAQELLDALVARASARGWNPTSFGEGFNRGITTYLEANKATEEPPIEH